MKRSFVFGKFLPFHKGHQAMIDFALSQCDYLDVLVCVSDKENISAETRTNWIKDTYSSQRKIHIQSFQYLESELPNTSESSQEVAKIWANIFLTLFPHHSYLITSEPYGEMVAAFMNIQHIPFDQGRRQAPISATAIRNNPVTHWHYLPDAVKPYYALKVVILGTESTGKTTLAQQLAKHYQATLVPEAARDIIANSNSFSFEDLLLVAETHAKHIETALEGNSPLIIIDTDIHTTISYAEFIFQQALNVPSAIYQINKANLYLYLQADIPYYQDGTRLNQSSRNALDCSHRAVLKKYGIEIKEISGTWEERFDAAIKCIDELYFGRVFNRYLIPFSLVQNNLSLYKNRLTMTNTQLIENFYQSFSKAHAEGMIQCYHTNIQFQDPAFDILHGDEARNMWRMLIASSKGNIKITFSDVQANETTGSAKWVAEYIFSQTGRKVINRISATFRFQDGKIIQHTDVFDMWKWSRQALGWKGLLLGWTGFMKKQIQARTRGLLRKFSAN